MNKLVKEVKKKYLFIDLEVGPKTPEATEYVQRESGIFLDSDTNKKTGKGYDIATVLQVGKEVKEEYKIGDKIMIPPINSAVPLKLNGKEFYKIDAGIVIAIL